MPILFALDSSAGTKEGQPVSAGKLVLTCPADECRHQADYTMAAVSRFQKMPGKPNESGRNNENSKIENANPELKVWCESCCIRVAPNEERTVVRGKTYHLQCYAKLITKPKIDVQRVST
jgi:hypothetical protein